MQPTRAFALAVEIGTEGADRSPGAKVRGQGCERGHEVGVLGGLPAGGYEGHGGQPFRMARRELEREEAAERVADQAGALDPQVIEQGRQVVHHRQAVERRPPGLVAEAMAPQVEADDAVVAGQRRSDTGQAPVQVAVDGETVQ